MPKAIIDDFEIYYEVRGSGTPVLLVPGMGGAGSYWNPNIEEFSKHFQVIVHDHRGTGQSSLSKIQYSVEQMTTDMIKLADALGLEKFHLVGHSTGAVMGQIAAVEHPDRLMSLVIYAGWIKATPFMRRSLEMRRELILKSGIEAYVKAVPIFLHPYWWVNENIETLEETERSIIGTLSDPGIQVSRMNAVLRYDGTQYLSKKIAIRTLVCCAKDDILTPMPVSEEIAANIPGCMTYWFDRGAHAVSQTVPEEFNRIVISFLRAQDSGEKWHS